MYVKLLIGNVDYESGPYNVKFEKRKTRAKFCIMITDDEISEMDETFGLTIDSNSLPSGLVVKDPSTVTVTIVDNECKYLCNLYSIYFCIISCQR